jgi:hypothetical protein
MYRYTKRENLMQDILKLKGETSIPNHQYFSSFVLTENAAENVV